MALSYPIIFEDSFSGLGERILETAGDRVSRICIISDAQVAALYLEEVERELSVRPWEICAFVFPAGEESKQLDTVRAVYAWLLDHHLQRNDLLLALGGGVTGDLTGFAAATYLRGISFVQVPTTLLAQVDSSVGGKTGVDFAQYKNMVGAFCQPKLVYMNMSVLQTLPDDQFASGMGEVIKTALIRDAGLFHWIREHAEEIRSRDKQALAHIVERCCAVKAAVVDEDPYDRGIRAILNFGHTIGHAVEREKGFALLHGQCVAIGMAGAVKISADRGLLSEKDAADILLLLQEFSLPIHASGLTEEQVLSACASDKKNEQGQLRFVLLRSVGDAFVEPSITPEELTGAIHDILC